MNPPCKDCPKKGCGRYHDECPEFQAYRAQQEEVYRLRHIRTMCVWHKSARLDRRTGFRK
jgi:hypothetical protein